MKSTNQRGVMRLDGGGGGVGGLTGKVDSGHSGPVSYGWTHQKYWFSARQHIMCSNGTMVAGEGKGETETVCQPMGGCELFQPDF